MIVTLTGSNHFALNEERRKLTGEFLKEHGDLALERLDGEEASYDRIVEAAQSLPFLASKKMVILRNPGVQKQFQENIQELLKNVTDTTDLIIIEPKLDKRISYYKTLKKQTDFRQFDQLEARDLARWLVDQAKEQGAGLQLADANYLVERVGPNQELVAHELEKLISFDANVTHQSIDLLTEPTPQSSIFELLDAAFAGNKKRTIELYKEQRALKVEPQQIVAMLAWQLHVLAVVKTAGDRPSGEIAREAKLSPFVVQKTQGIARKLSMPEVKKLIRDALRLDIRLKSQGIDADEALQYFLLTISRE
ncbi:MAG TPA: DNA polymerase III subunit delta [Candidatus Saccharimonadales bacterium]|nr:DNA polymerase III subunit delta [Candidatus Saccharimonadales bacterium]